MDQTLSRPVSSVGAVSDNAGSKPRSPVPTIEQTSTPLQTSVPLTPPTSAKHLRRKHRGRRPSDLSLSPKAPHKMLAPLSHSYQVPNCNANIL